MAKFIKVSSTEVDHTKYKDRATLQRAVWKYKLKELKDQPLLVSLGRERKGDTHLVRVYQIYDHHAVFAYDTYDCTGKTRGSLKVSINYNSLICGDDRVLKVDD